MFGKTRNDFGNVFAFGELERKRRMLPRSRGPITGSFSRLDGMARLKGDPSAAKDAAMTRSAGTRSQWWHRSTSQLVVV
jgi:hypothetical protein